MPVTSNDDDGEKEEEEDDEGRLLRPKFFLQKNAITAPCCVPRVFPNVMKNIIGKTVLPIANGICEKTTRRKKDPNEWKRGN